MSLVDQFENRMNSLSRCLDWVARAAVLGVMATFCGNIILRLFGKPIVGTYEIVSFIGSMAISFALPYCSVKKAHIAVELLISRLPDRMQATIDTFTGILSLGLFVIIAWQSGAYATNMWHTGVMTAALKWPLYPFMYGMVLGTSMLCVVLFLDVVKSLMKMVEK